MKLVDIYRGHISIEAYGKAIKIYGEALLRGHGSPDFVVYSNSIERWDFPDNQEKVPDSVKNEIFLFLQTEFLKRNLTLAIE